MLLQRVDQTMGRGGEGGVAPGHPVCPLGSWSYLVILAFKLAGMSCGISLHIGSVFVF